MSVTFEEAERIVLSGTTRLDVFGAVDPDRAYRDLALVLHPDHNPTLAERATAAFARLTELWSGDVKMSAFTITTKRQAYAVQQRAAFKGELANLYRAAYDLDGVEQHALLKFARDPRDRAPLQREASVLRKLATEGDEHYQAFVPTLVETFRHRDKTTRVERQVNALEDLSGFHSLTEVHRQYPGGISGRDAAWMWRRLLVALGFAHRVGVVHGAVFPEHVLIHPEKHGLVLIDWCYSVDVGQKPTRSTDHGFRSDRHWHPPEEAYTEASDVWMATQTMTHVLGPRLPKPLATFSRGCTLKQESMRPHDAWELKEELDDLLERMYGQRRFEPFWMPTREEPHG